MSDTVATILAILMGTSVPLIILIVTIIRVAVRLSQWDYGNDQHDSVQSENQRPPIVALITPEQIRQRAEAQREDERRRHRRFPLQDVEWPDGRKYTASLTPPPAGMSPETPETPAK